jgi:small subunit ribosomal protein S5
MTDTDVNANEVAVEGGVEETTAPVAVVAPTPVATPAPTRGGDRNFGRDGGRGGDRGGDRRQRRDRVARKPRSEYETKIIDIRRVTRVVAGGRRFSFSVTLVLGNGKGQVGVGIGKAGDTALAIDKATRNAKKSIIHVPLTADLSIPHDVQAKYDASEVMLIPTPGRGFKAGSATRTVLEFAGVKHVSAKILSRSKNQLNNARATLEALRMLKPIAYKMNAPKKFDRMKAAKEAQESAKDVEKKPASKVKSAPAKATADKKAKAE